MSTAETKKVVDDAMMRFNKAVGRMRDLGVTPGVMLTLPEEVSASLAARTYFHLVKLLKAATEEDPDGELELVYTPLLARLKALLVELEEEAKAATRKKVARADAELEELLNQSESTTAYTPTLRVARRHDDPSR